MAYQFASLKTKAKEVEEWLKKEFSGIRTGRAAPSLLDGIRVDSYGSKVPLNQVGNISVEDARTIRIAPWDKSQIKDIEKAIAEADLGISTGSDDNGVRVSFPELTSDRRAQLQKLTGQKLEEARIRVRSLRDDVWQDIQKQEKDGKISEDDKFRGKDEMQKIIDEANKSLDALAKKKEEEITQ